ncbi:MAG: hypothetical protein DSY77_02090 [Bacteroidetes bacterium]|nr:MAG: hypothetical protein DSY77_02090 [Bacteroidota bacterium]
MEKAIGKELISYLLKLEVGQQEKVLAYIKGILSEDEINSRAEDSEIAISTGKVKSFEEFNNDFENWKEQKRVGVCNNYTI